MEKGHVTPKFAIWINLYEMKFVKNTNTAGNRDQMKSSKSQCRLEIIL